MRARHKLQRKTTCKMDQAKKNARTKRA